MTQYVVLQVENDENEASAYIYADKVEASNATKACRKVAEEMSDDELTKGVTLVAVPARNWASGRNTFAAKTERKLIRS